MSYDIFLTPPQSQGVEVGNMTYNIRPMFDHAFGVEDWKEVVWGKKALDVIPDIFFAHKMMKDNPEEFKPLEPENGWGSYEGALGYLYKLLVACCENPDCTIHIH